MSVEEEKSNPNKKDHPSSEDFIDDGTTTQKQEGFELQLEDEEEEEEEGGEEKDTSTSIVEAYQESIDTDLPLDTTIALTPSSRKSLILGIVSAPPSTLDTKESEDLQSNTNVPPTSETSKDDEEKTTAEQDTKESENLSDTNVPPTAETTKDDEEKTPVEQGKPPMRKRRLSAVPKLDVIDEDNNTFEAKSVKEKVPIIAPSEDHSTDEEEEKSVVELSQSLKKNEDISSLQVTPLRRSRRRLSSQSSDSEGEIKSTSRKNTPISSSSKKRPNLKKVAMEPLIEDEGEAKEQSSTVSKPGRKRRLSAVPQLDIISEEVTTSGDDESSPRKSKKESDDAQSLCDDDDQSAELIAEKRNSGRRARKIPDRYNLNESEITASPPIKRTPGRPRKNPIPVEEEKTLEVVMESDISSLVKKRPGQYLEESETAVSPIKKTPGRPRKNPIPVEDNTSEVVKEIVKKPLGQYPEESEIAVTPPAIKKTPGRPRKNPIPVEKKILEVIKDSDISDTTSASPVKKTPGRPRKNPIPLEVIKESDISDTARSSRKSVSTSSVSQRLEAPPVTRSRSHSNTTKVLDTMFTPVKTKPSRTTVSQNF